LHCRKRIAAFGIQTVYEKGGFKLFSAFLKPVASTGEGKSARPVLNGAIKALLSSARSAEALLIGGRTNEEPYSPWFGILRDAGPAGFRAG
jgi:hypothetical protein